MAIALLIFAAAIPFLVLAYLLYFAVKWSVSAEPWIHDDFDYKLKVEDFKWNTSSSQSLSSE